MKMSDKKDFIDNSRFNNYDDDYNYNYENLDDDYFKYEEEYFSQNSNEIISKTKNEEDDLINVINYDIFSSQLNEINDITIYQIFILLRLLYKNLLNQQNLYLEIIYLNINIVKEIKDILIWIITIKPSKIELFNKYNTPLFIYNILKKNENLFCNDSNLLDYYNDVIWHIEKILFYDSSDDDGII